MQAQHAEKVPLQQQQQDIRLLKSFLRSPSFIFQLLLDHSKCNAYAQTTVTVPPSVRAPFSALYRSNDIFIKHAF